MVQIQRGGPSETIHPRYHRDVPWQPQSRRCFHPLAADCDVRIDLALSLHAPTLPSASTVVDEQKRPRAPPYARQIESRYTRLTAVASAKTLHGDENLIRECSRSLNGGRKFVVARYSTSSRPPLVDADARRRAFPRERESNAGFIYILACTIPLEFTVLVRCLRELYNVQENSTRKNTVFCWFKCHS